MSETTDAPEKRQYRPRSGEPRTAADTAASTPHVAAGDSGWRDDTRRDEHQDEDATRRTRVSREDRQTGSFDIPRNRRRPGWDYQWEVTSILGQGVDPSKVTEAYEGGWRPEAAGNWPELCPPGTDPKATVDRQGQRLFSRPMHLTEDARREDYNAAEQQKRDRVQGALEGRVKGNEGLADIKGARPVSLGVSVEGEVGTHSGPRR